MSRFVTGMKLAPSPCNPTLTAPLSSRVATPQPLAVISLPVGVRALAMGMVRWEVECQGVVVRDILARYLVDFDAPNLAQRWRKLAMAPFFTLARPMLYVGPHLATSPGANGSVEPTTEPI